MNDTPRLITAIGVFDVAAIGREVAALASIAVAKTAGAAP